jgi:competence protein ComEA
MITTSARLQDEIDGGCASPGNDGRAGVTHWTLVRYGVLAALVSLTVALLAHVMIDRYTPTPSTIGPVTDRQIVVMVDGAVVTPGVVELPADARLQDAIDAVGGLTPNADPGGLNLASRLRDGERITIPELVGPPPPAVEPSGATPDAPAPSLSGLIDLNTASVAQLDTLPGIGPVIAQRIVDFREFYGPFESIDQLAEIEGISPAMVDRIRPMVTVGG